MRFSWLLALGVTLAFSACTQTPATSRAPQPLRPASAPLALSGSENTAARDAFVLLSGGGTPLTNNYSQYLQARAVAAFLTQHYPADRTWVFFGVGNRDGEAPVLADARRQVKRDGLVVESWEPGTLPHNRPATRDSFLRALRDEILPTVRDGGTLFLFVGDHGGQADGENGESEITLWQLKRRGRRDWETDHSEVLGVKELRDTLAAGIGRGRVVFLMTQCHSGGFHFLGTPREMTPPTEWFTRVPGWAWPRGTAPLVAAAGFTATDEGSIAAGCVPDPDPERWAGYERFAPEQWLGVDLFTLVPKAPAQLSFAAAHEAATLVDRTIDKPRATSDQFLATWADTIERLAKENDLVPRVSGAVEAYRRAIDRGAVSPGGSAEFRAKAEQLARFTQRAATQVARGGDTLLTGTGAQLEALTRGNEPRGGDGGRPARARGIRAAWRDTIRPAWKRAVMAGKVPGLSATELAFEKRILALEDRDRDVMFGGGNALLNETYWASTYAEPARFDRAKAEAITRWAAQRRERVADWAKASADPALRTAGETLFRRPAAAMAAANAATETAPGIEPLATRTAGERVMFYRRVLAAWEFLEAVQHRAALDQLQALLELERTPLPVNRS